MSFGLKNILILDDERFVVEILEEMLIATNPNIQVDKAFNGDTAKEFLEKNSYDLILSDFLMPHYNGVDFIEDIRLNFPHNKETPILMVTAVKNSAAPLISHWNKVAIMSKPITFSKLEKALNDLELK